MNEKPQFTGWNTLMLDTGTDVVTNFDSKHKYQFR